MYYEVATGGVAVKEVGGVVGVASVYVFIRRIFVFSHSN